MLCRSAIGCPYPMWQWVIYFLRSCFNDFVSLSFRSGHLSVRRLSDGLLAVVVMRGCVWKDELAYF